MSDPLSNLEIQDVLSSIRRLVSEDRRTKETGQEATAAAEVPAGKLLLTEAHRIEIVPDQDDAGAAEVEAGAVTADLSAAEATQDADWNVTLASATVLPAAPAPIRPASVLEDDIASLETTIAELEAAVEGIGHDFEPDGSEVRGVSEGPDQQALEDAFDTGFIVDVGGPSGVGHEDAALALPVAGDAMSAPRPGKTPDRPIAAEGVAADLQTAEEDSGTGVGVDEIAFLRREPPARRPDWQVISGGDGLLATAGAILSGRLHLRPSDSVEDAAGVAGGGAAADAVLATEAVADTPLAEGDDDAVAGRWDATAAIAAVPAQDEVAAFAAGPAQDDLAQMAGPDPAVADAADEVLTGIPTAPEEAAADVLSHEAPGTDAATTDAAAEEDVQLFAADDDTVIDMDMLRDLVAEVIREELQGPLGERITRNVRKLVRQEIARALEAQKFD